MTVLDPVTQGVRLTGAQTGIVNAQLVHDDPALFTVGEFVHLTVPDDATELRATDVADAVRQAVVESGLHGVRIAPDGSSRRVAEEFSAPAIRSRDEVSRTLPLGPDPLHDQQVLVLGPRHVVWTTVWHHVLVDGWGVGLIVRRVCELLAAARGGSPAPSAWFADPDVAAEAEQQYLASDAYLRDREFWSGRSGSHDAVRGFGDPGRSRGQALRRSGRLAVRDLDVVADRFGVTWAELLVAATSLALARAGNGDDHGQVVLGVPFMNRMGSAAALSPTTVVNVLPLALDVDPSCSVAEFLASVTAGLRGLRRHGRFRAEELARLSGRLVQDRPLVGAELNLKTFDHPARAADVEVAVENLSEGPVDDLSISITRGRDGELRWDAVAPVGVLDAARIEAVLELLDGLLGELEQVVPETRLGSLASRGVTGFSTSAVDTVSAVELLASSVRNHPERVALVDADHRWTYAELGARVASVARSLSGVSGPVALDLPRGVEAVAAYLGCLVAGRTAVPLDRDWPEARRAALVERLGTEAVRLTELPEFVAATLDEFTIPAPETPAYVIHTSGSTGEPKAVLVTHGAFAAFVAHHRATTFADVPAGLRVAQTLPLVFDGSWDTLQAVLLGHEVHLLPKHVVQDPATTVQAVRDSRLEFVDTTPTIVGALLDAGLLAPGHPLRILSVGGEACPPTLWAQLTSEPGLVVRNLYGPTEATVDAIGLDGRDRAVGGTPIGRPVHGMTARVLDEHLQPAVAGFPGELHLAGPQLALGYRGASAATASRFVADPYGAPGARMYRTGDLVRVRPDGMLDYLGRADRQVKVRGYRIEPAEVEAGLRELPGVLQTAVVVRAGRLIGYVVGPASADGLREAVARFLPEHLVPAAVVVVAGLPRTPTGKLDPDRLPDPVVTPDGRPPKGAAEIALAAAWGEALQLSTVDADTDFFALGGDSITAIRAVAAFRARGFASSVSQVFTLRTVAAIAAAATSVVAEPPAPTVPQFDQTQLNRVHDLIARRTRRPGGPSQ